MEDALLVGILLLLLTLALLRVKKHFRGGCCSGGSAVLRDEKTLSEPIIGQFSLRVSDMHCQNCQNRIENALNGLDGVLCRANWRKKTVAVYYSREFSVDEAVRVVEELGYHADGIR